MKRRLLSFLLGGASLVPCIVNAQPTPTAPRLIDLDGLRQANPATAPYVTVFEDNFDSYANAQAMKAAPAFPGSNDKKWRFNNSCKWNIPINGYNNTQGALLEMENNVDIQPISATDPTNKVLVLKSTYYSTPLELARDNNGNLLDENIAPPNQPAQLANYLITPPPTTPGALGSAKIHLPNWSNTLYSLPRFYRTTAAVIPSYYNTAAPGYDNEAGLWSWMHGFRYGIFQVRCKLPKRGGIQGAFWLFGGSRTGASGYCANDPDGNMVHGWEIDGFESNNYGYYKLDATPQDSYIGPLPDGNRKFHSTLQPNDLNGQQGLSTFNNFPFSLDGVYHVYTIAWTPTSITWFVDGVETRTDDTSRGIPYSSMQLILSTNYLWNWGRGTVNENTPPNAGIPDALVNNGAETDFLVDWVKVWKPNPAVYAGNQTVGSWPAYKTALTWQKTQIADLNLGPNTVAAVGPVYRSNYQKLYFTTTATPSRLGVVYFDGSNWATSTNLTGVWPGSGLAMESSTGKLFYVGEDGHIWNRETNGNLSRLNWDSSMQPNATNHTQDLAYDGAPDVNDPNSNLRDSNGNIIPRVRVYYTTGSNGIGNGITGRNQLWYYEWTPNQSWQQHSTYVYNVAGSITVVSGRVYYKGLDGNMWRYAYEPTPNGGYWNAGSLNPGCYPADVDKIVGGVAFNGRPDLDRVYYLTSNKELKYYEYTPRYKQDVIVNTPCWIEARDRRSDAYPPFIPLNDPDLVNEYLRKFDDNANVPSAPGYCPSAANLPHWRLRTTGQTVGQSGSIAHFNNQLLFVDNTGNIQEYRNFKRWNGNKLDFAPTASWYTNLGSTLSTVPSSASTAQLFGMEDNRLYSVGTDGKVWYYSTNELLNPIGNSEETTRTPRRPAVLTTASVAKAEQVVTAYPNPTSVNITFNHPTSIIIRVEVWDLTGKRLQTVSANAPSVTMETATLASGMYVYKVTDRTGKVSVGKFTK